jgi:hypothetical protein
MVTAVALQVNSAFLSALTFIKSTGISAVRVFYVYGYLLRFFSRQEEQ